jgi:hypothetical protein
MVIMFIIYSPPLAYRRPVPVLYRAFPPGARPLVRTRLDDKFAARAENQAPVESVTGAQT